MKINPIPESFIMRVLRGIKYRQGLPLRAIDSDCPSYVWTSLMASKALLMLGINKKVHLEYQIRVWEDLWIPSVRAIPPVVSPQMTMSEFIHGSLKEWNT